MCFCCSTADNCMLFIFTGVFSNFNLTLISPFVERNLPYKYSKIDWRFISYFKASLGKDKLVVAYRKLAA